MQTLNHSAQLAAHISDMQAAFTAAADSTDGFDGDIIRWLKGRHHKLVVLERDIHNSPLVQVDGAAVHKLTLPIMEQLVAFTATESRVNSLLYSFGVDIINMEATAQVLTKLINLFGAGVANDVGLFLWDCGAGADRALEVTVRGADGCDVDYCISDCGALVAFVDAAYYADGASV